MFKKTGKATGKILSEVTVKQGSSGKLEMEEKAIQKKKK